MSDESQKPSADGTGESPRRIAKRQKSFRMGDATSVPDGEPSTTADFEFWAKMAIWNIEEAVALSFERNPEVITRSFLQKHCNTQFAENFRRIQKLAERATQAGILRNPCLPLEFIEWTHLNRIPFSEGLAQVVATHVNESKKRKNQTRLSKSSPQEEGPGNSKSVKSLLKLVGGLAVAIYKYDPASKKSDVPSLIQSDLDLVGVNLDVDTIRKYLRLGVESAEIQAA